MSISDTDTICAIATPPGKSGIGVVRISGPLCKQIAIEILGFSPKPRHAYFSPFYSKRKQVIDKGIAIFFHAPNSFTGEDILELQGHGGFFVLNSILKEVLKYGVRIANPGEFSERSFVNSKMDLVQIEAIADLINASTEQAARSALRTMEGEFSRLIQEIVNSVVELRVFIEAAIDFTEEEIDFLSDHNTKNRLHTIITLVEDVIRKAKQGAILREGMTVAIAGKPNAGKSSLLNALSGKDTAIVTDIPGTTRDIVIEILDIDGMPVHIIDTAGLRESQDVVEQEGIRRARKAIGEADIVLLVIDLQTFSGNSQSLIDHCEETGLPQSVLDSGKTIVVFNKTDLVGYEESTSTDFLIDYKKMNWLRVSAKTCFGIEQLREQLKQSVGFSVTEEGSFMARERHIDALNRTRHVLDSASIQLLENGLFELVAEDLRMAQKYLGEITGDFTTDDLLAEIFSSFCVGK